MRKRILNISIFIGLFMGLVSNIFAFDANLQLDKSETSLNDYINLRVEINSTEGGQIGITDIKGLENFDLINQSQSQSSSTSMIMVNGKTQNKTKSTINLDLTLKPKSKGDFVLGPAILEEGTGKVLTNTVKIKVGGDNIFINNNQLNTSNIGNNLLNNKNIKSNSEIEKYDNVKERNFDNSKDLYLLLIILLLTGIGFYLINNKKINLNKQKNNIQENIKDKENSEGLKKEINFEKTEKIKYPEINDNDFISKVDSILRNKLELKFNIKNIKSKTYNELLNDIGKNELLEELIKMINNAKYSNNIGNNNKILELLKDI